MKFEIAGVEDISVLLELVNKAYKHEETWKSSLRTTRHDLLQVLGSSEVLVYKCKVDLEIVACGTLSYINGLATFGMLSVWPEHHGKGYGYSFIQFLEKEAKKAGYLKMHCEVASFNKHLMGYYQKLGYVRYDSKPWKDPSLKIPGVTFEFFRKMLTAP